MSNYAKFHAKVLENLPHMSSEIRQGWIENPAALARALATLAPPAAFLVLISLGENLTVGPCDGQRTIAGSQEVFSSGIDDNFEFLGTNVSGKPTISTMALVYKLVQDGTFEQMFGSLDIPVNQRCWEQDQIIDFVLNHSASLRRGGNSNFFPFKVGNEFFVAGVRVYDDGRMAARVHPFSSDVVWLAEYCNRLIVPQRPTKP